MRQDRRRKFVGIAFIILVSLPTSCIGARGNENTQAVHNSAKSTNAATGATAPNAAKKVKLVQCKRFVYDTSNADEWEKKTVNALQENSSLVHEISEFFKKKQEWMTDKIDQGQKISLIKFLIKWAKIIIYLPANVFAWWIVRYFVNRYLRHKAECLGLNFDEIRTDNVRLSRCHPFRTQLRWLKMYVKAHLNGTKTVDGNELVKDLPCLKKYWGRKWMGISKKDANKSIKEAQEKGLKVPEEYLRDDQKEPVEEVDDEEVNIIEEAVVESAKSPAGDTKARRKRAISYIYDLLDETNANLRFKRSEAIFGYPLAGSVGTLILSAVIVASVITLAVGIVVLSPALDKAFGA